MPCLKNHKIVIYKEPMVCKYYVDKLIWFIITLVISASFITLFGIVSDLVDKVIGA